jgi:hypothetical protein
VRTQRQDGYRLSAWDAQGPSGDIDDPDGMDEGLPGHDSERDSPEADPSLRPTAGPSGGVAKGAGGQDDVLDVEGWEEPEGVDDP